MSLPVYHHINLKVYSLEELNRILTPEMNLKHPVVINLLELEFDHQREVIGLIENFFSELNISFKFPYPVYIISEHEASITKVPLLHDQKDLPKFFIQKEGKMNVKETHVAGKNKLLQQDVKNGDAEANTEIMRNYATAHRKIFELEKERLFYKNILNRQMKGQKNG